MSKSRERYSANVGRARQSGRNGGNLPSGGQLFTYLQRGVEYMMQVIEQACFGENSVPRQGDHRGASSHLKNIHTLPIYRRIAIKANDWLKVLLEQVSRA
ncbi:hypothetical protein QFC21_005821 [Naganishia friedmannii]|uniref:Uncharacterized protein n=1 Tax=Naganishia friedmannii TaxID=89922 RepID=A0ACC2V7I8_9TREE|nr:hypothetical protein QFC21_005821 [Naganishia friedmannii]